MTDFVKDIWNDLREKRLWPVAVVMLLGIVAIPAVLAKSSTAPISDPAPMADAAAVRSSLALDTETAAASGKGSSLDVFAPDDPFLPPRVAVAESAASDTAVDATAAGAGGVDVSVGVGGGSTDETVDVKVEEPSPPQQHSETKTTSYEYVADISFWQGDRRRRIKGLRKLDMLPNQTSPVLIFMGANGDGGNATFLVDSSLKTAGEGTCRPSPSNCAFVDIGPGAEHAFTSEEGESFRVRVEEIRRVKVKAGASASGSDPTAHTSVGEQPAARHFTLPSLVDLIEVSTTKTTTSGGNAKADSSQGQGGR